MSLNEEDIKAVVFYRKEKAYATLREAEDMIDKRIKEQKPRQCRRLCAL